MENKEGKEGKEGCCGDRHCCTGKAALVLVLLLIGGLIGYGAGRCHSSRWACHTGMNGSMSAGPTTPQK